MGPTSVGWLNVLIEVAAALTAVATIWAKGVRPMMRLARLHDTVSKMASQFEANGGNSLRDQVDRLVTGVEGLGSTLDAHVKQDAAQFAALSDRLDGIRNV